MKNKKRLIAAGLAVLILVFSLKFSSAEPAVNKEDDSLSIDSVQSVQSLVNGEKKAVKKILKAGNSSEVIQKIKIKGEIKDEMIDRESDHSVISQIKKAKEDPNVKAILLAVDSPGGGVYESREIYEALKNSGKDVYVTMESYATSGGYYVAMAGKKIFAHQETMTGSLGVIMSSLSAQKFLNDNGIKNQIIRSGSQKAVGGLTEDMNEETLKLHKDIITEAYDRFVDVIAKGRNMDTNTVKSLADGRVYTANQALGHKLIDKIAGEEDMINEIKNEKKLFNPEVIEYKKPEATYNFLKSFISETAKAITEEVNKSTSSSSNVQMKYLG
ncbi:MULTISPECIES: signal peptide peptidase SppA [unclassified Gemella]|uniref:signal peptide peptidase SppA n=1 Tax=unclassified Gemella TaxID=2624949 RepID=UPI0010743322|nr:MULTISPECIES: signal peptide peptidase SppA [unclassified Gemella]MBF0710510.1 signal peptide peptidase SppA [Gemella sp. GL1.1]MBF0746548.1 signal peptide peptidase SppA [Gemella sp. 19428wG2_WT2a]NYS27854.1 signal peptide peptidase SppA [Gemella sp. GL1]TFU59909.1 signal peptide peptidase SppA [Gemella sp. WT2a]